MSDLIGKIEMNDSIHPHEYLVIQPDKSISKGIRKVDAEGKIYRQRIPLDEFYNISNKRSVMSHNIASSEVMGPMLRIEKIESITGSMQDMTGEQKLAILEEIESGEQWGADMRQEMMLLYEALEEDLQGEPTGKIANSMTWSYNQDFVDFGENWIDGHTKEDGTRQLGFNELTSVQQITATYQFLEGIIDSRDGKRKVNARKIPPVSNNEGESMLDPEIMQAYFEVYNTIAKDYKLDAESYELIPRRMGTEKLVKEWMGCE
jgi:hypothetical protein